MIEQHHEHAGRDQKIEMNENRVYGINTSQTHDNVIVMKANQVYGVSDSHGEIVMEKNGGVKDEVDYVNEGMDTKHTEYDYITN